MYAGIDQIVLTQSYRASSVCDVLAVIRDCRSHPNPVTPTQAAIDWLGKLKLDRPSLAVKHTAFSTGC